MSTLPIPTHAACPTSICFPPLGCLYHLKIPGQLKKLCRTVAVLGPSGFPQQNTFHWDRLQPGEQVCSCIRAHVIHFIPVLTFSLLYLFEKCVCRHWQQARQHANQSCSGVLLRKEGPMLHHCSSCQPSNLCRGWKLQWCTRWNALRCGYVSISARPPAHITRSSLPHLGDKDTQKNIVPSRSPPDLTSRLLLIYSSVGCLCRSNQCRLRTIIRFPWSWELTGWMQRWGTTKLPWQQRFNVATQPELRVGEHIDSDIWLE